VQLSTVASYRSWLFEPCCDRSDLYLAGYNFRFRIHTLRGAKITFCNLTCLQGLNCDAEEDTVDQAADLLSCKYLGMVARTQGAGTSGERGLASVPPPGLKNPSTAKREGNPRQLPEQRLQRKGGRDADAGLLIRAPVRFLLTYVCFGSDEK
jgi:hypothetical protein